eukprot:1520766-Amphidinium_carterae.1
MLLTGRLLKDQPRSGPTTIKAWTHVHQGFIQVEDVVKRNSVLSSQPQELPLQVLLDGCDLI